MLAPLLWLTPTAKDLLKSTSALLAGAVPCPAAKLASALREADDSKCTGLLASDASLRKELAEQIEKAGPKEISDKTVAGLVDAFGAVLEVRVKAIQAKAAPVKKALPTKGPMPGFKEVVALLPKGTEVGDALRKDWWISHSVGCAHSPKDLAEPAGGVVRDWLAIAACAGSGLVSDCALSLHLLDNVDAYIKWETALPASKPPAKKAADLKGVEVLFPFDAATATEVALRRVLARALTAEAATSAASSGGDVKAVLKKMADSARAEAVIPLYTAPPAPKEPKDKKGDAKEPKDNKKGDAKHGGATKAAPASGGALAAMLKATAGKELQWNLFQYQLHRRTALSDASTSSAAAGNGKNATAPNGAAGKPAGGQGSCAGTGAQGFAGTWAPQGLHIPPGHTPDTWGQGEVKKNFASIWAPAAGQLPPGHTMQTWETGQGGGATASSSKGKAPAAKAPVAKADKAATPAPKAKAAAAAAPAAAGGATPEEGSNAEALCKIDVRCGRILECGKVPDADSLYLLKVDVGEPEPRQVVSSLVKFYKEDELKNREVMVYCNIKPGKMRGFDSQAMVLAAVTDKGTDNEKCELLAPPAGVAAGAHPMSGAVEVGSLSATQNVSKISKVWGKVQPLLLTNDKGEATFDGTILKLNGSSVTVPSLKKAPIS